MGAQKDGRQSSMHAPIHGTSESRAKYMFKYRNVLGSFSKSFRGLG